MGAARELEVTLKQQSSYVGKGYSSKSSQIASAGSCMLGDNEFVFYNNQEAQNPTLKKNRIRRPTKNICSPGRQELVDEGRRAAALQGQRSPRMGRNRKNRGSDGAAGQLGWQSVPGRDSVVR